VVIDGTDLKSQFRREISDLETATLSFGWESQKRLLYVVTCDVHMFRDKPGKMMRGITYETNETIG